MNLANLKYLTMLQKYAMRSKNYDYPMRLHKKKKKLKLIRKKDGTKKKKD